MPRRTAYDCSTADMSYDNTRALGASTWRHVAFVEKPGPAAAAAPSTSACRAGPRTRPGDATASVRWLMSSDVCKHCTHAACLDVCPTGALFRTEFGTVVVQADICNGCGYCVPGLPLRRDRPAQGSDGRGRLQVHAVLRPARATGLKPACATGLPDRVDPVRRRSTSCGSAPTPGWPSSTSGASPRPGSTATTPTTASAATGAFFLLLDEPEVYGLPPDPVVTTRDLPSMWRHVGAAAALTVGRDRGRRVPGRRR